MVGGTEARIPLKSDSGVDKCGKWRGIPGCLGAVGGVPGGHGCGGWPPYTPTG